MIQTDQVGDLKMFFNNTEARINFLQNEASCNGFIPFPDIRDVTTRDAIHGTIRHMGESKEPFVYFNCPVSEKATHTSSETPVCVFIVDTFYLQDLLQKQREQKTTLGKQIKTFGKARSKEKKAELSNLTNLFEETVKSITYYEKLKGYPSAKNSFSKPGYKVLVPEKLRKILL